MNSSYLGTLGSAHNCEFCDQFTIVSAHNCEQITKFTIVSWSQIHNYEQIPQLSILSLKLLTVSKHLIIVNFVNSSYLGTLWSAHNCERSQLWADHKIHNYEQIPKFPSMSCSLTVNNLKLKIGNCTKFINMSRSHSSQF